MGNFMDDFVSSFIKLLLIVFIMGVLSTLAVIYGFPYVWAFIKPWFYSITG